MTADILELVTKPVPDDGLIKTLEEWLEQAKMGEVVAFGLAGVRRTGGVQYVVSCGEQRLLLLSAVTLLHEAAVRGVVQVG